MITINFLLTFPFLDLRGSVSGMEMEKIIPPGRKLLPPPPPDVERGKTNPITREEEKGDKKGAASIAHRRSEEVVTPTGDGRLKRPRLWTTTAACRPEAQE